jgi:hypothetical protein
VYEHYGVMPTYKTGLLSENVLVNLKHRGQYFFSLHYKDSESRIYVDNQNYRRIAAEDANIDLSNQKLQGALDRLVKSQRAVAAKERQHEMELDPVRRQKFAEELTKKKNAEGKALQALAKLQEQASSLEGTGSGRIQIIDHRT